MNAKNVHKHQYFMPKIFIYPDPEDVENRPTEYTTEWNDFRMSKVSEQRFYSCNSNLENNQNTSDQVFEPLDSNHFDDPLRMEKLETRNDLLNFSEEGNSEESDSKDDGHGAAWIIIILTYIVVVLTFPFSLLICLKIVQEYERAVIFRLGRLTYGGAKGPGIFFILPCIETYTKVDLRTISFDVPPQEVLTRDSVTITVDAVVNYRICNAVVSVANVEDAHQSTRLIAQTTLRNVLGTKYLSEILSERESISIAIQEQLTSATYPWGIQMERVEIKDCRLPKILQRSMAAEAEAAREARAKEIASEGEKSASLALKEASKILNKSSTAIQLRYLQTLINVANEKTSTIIFPLPVGLIQFFLDSRTN